MLPPLFLRRGEYAHTAHRIGERVSAIIPDPTSLLGLADTLTRQIARSTDPTTTLTVAPPRSLLLPMYPQAKELEDLAAASQDK